MIWAVSGWTNTFYCDASVLFLMVISMILCACNLWDSHLEAGSNGLGCGYACNLWDSDAADLETGSNVLGCGFVCNFCDSDAIDLEAESNELGCESDPVLPM